MFRAFFCSRKWAVWAYGGGILSLVLIWFQVRLTVSINEWYGRFYNLLQVAPTYQAGNRSEDGIRKFFNELISVAYISSGFKGHPSFAILAMPYVLLAVFINWFTRIYVLRWREAMTFDYIPRWRIVTLEIEGASQRIQEDCKRFAEVVHLLGLGFARAGLTLFSFIPVLYKLSEDVDVPFLRGVDGSLVWGSLAVSFGGIVISWFVGWKLPGLEYTNQKVEAAFRKDLVLGEDDKVTYAQPQTLFNFFADIRRNYQTLYAHYLYFDTWSNLYSQAMTIVPYLLVGRGLFTGTATLGVMIQVANAFEKVHTGFSFFLENWVTITELRSIWKRLDEFERHILQHQEPSNVQTAHPASKPHYQGVSPKIPRVDEITDAIVGSTTNTYAIMKEAIVEDRKHTTLSL